MNTEGLPPWAVSILRDPRSGDAVRLERDRLVSTRGAEMGRVENGVLRIPVERPDEGIAFYRKIGGAHFHERAAVPFAMSALDTPLYHSHLDKICPASRDDVIVDIGGGDGRNAQPWLERGYRRVVVLDAVAEAFFRFRARIAEKHPEWLGRLLLVEADIRSLPLADHCAEAVLAIESLYYLNEDYEIGLKACARLLTDSGRMLLSERDYEAGLVMRLLHHGLEGLLQSARTHSLWDGPPDALMRTRCFTEAELIDVIAACGLKAIAINGMPLLSLILGWMRGRNMLGEAEARRLPEVTRLLQELGQRGHLRRCHVVIAQRA
jgi:SAM-dependent methyltransferase